MSERSLTLPTMLVAVVVSATQGSLPDKPDFSGAWILQAGVAGPGIPKTLSIEQTVARTNVRGDPMEPYFKEIRITRSSDEGTRSETFQIGIVGGTVSGRPRTAGTLYTQQRVFWEERSLVIETGTYDSPAPPNAVWAERREEWSLGADGLLHLSMTTKGARTATSTVTLIYRRAG